MVGKRHASGEITAKLAQANELAAKGKTQREISKALGVSIMTYHRWKKTVNAEEPADVPRHRAGNPVWPIERCQLRRESNAWSSKTPGCGA